MSTTHPHLVHVIDDEMDIRESLRLLLRNHKFQVETYVSAEDFLDRISDDMTGCILSDIRMGNMDGLQLQEVLIKKRVTLPMIFITGHGDVPMCATAMKNGAIDFLLKPFSKVTLIETVNQACRLWQEKEKSMEDSLDIRQRFERLTPREREIFNLLVAPEGQNTSRKIAEKLSISVRTAEKHRLVIFKKMAVNNLLQLIILSQRMSA